MLGCLMAMQQQLQHAPADYTIAEPLGCECSQCQPLQAFLEHPEQSTFEVTLASWHVRHM